VFDEEMEMSKKFHLGWFMNFIPPEWDTPWASPDVANWPNGRFYVDMAKSLERACFDYIMIEDTVMVADAYGGTMEGSLKNSVFAPKHDPVPLAVLIAATTSKLGVVATMSTSFYPPYLLARLASTVDSIAEGRFGWNIVSSAERHKTSVLTHCPSTTSGTTSPTSTTTWSASCGSRGMRTRS
jgi:long-chain alkane monooxygenase